jgi:hypothetical protein
MEIYSDIAMAVDGELSRPEEGLTLAMEIQRFNRRWSQSPRPQDDKASYEATITSDAPITSTDEVSG